MSITILNYHDQAFVDQINASRCRPRRIEKAAAEAAKAQAASSDFSSVLTNASGAYSGSTTCSEDLSAIFDEAANTYGVSSTLLKSIARAESNFNTSAVSSAGAVGIMQLMPATAASLASFTDALPRISWAVRIDLGCLAHNGDNFLRLRHTTPAVQMSINTAVFHRLARHRIMSRRFSPIWEAIMNNCPVASHPRQTSRYCNDGKQFYRRKQHQPGHGREAAYAS